MRRCGSPLESGPAAVVWNYDGQGAPGFPVFCRSWGLGRATARQACLVHHIGRGKRMSTRCALERSRWRTVCVVYWVLGVVAFASWAYFGPLFSSSQHDGTPFYRFFGAAGVRIVRDVASESSFRSWSHLMKFKWVAWPIRRKQIRALPHSSGNASRPMVSLHAGTTRQHGPCTSRDCAQGRD
jgi:hypothetical protein